MHINELYNEIYCTVWDVTLFKMRSIEDLWIILLKITHNQRWMKNYNLCDQPSHVYDLPGKPMIKQR